MVAVLIPEETLMDPLVRTSGRSFVYTSPRSVWELHHVEGDSLLSISGVKSQTTGILEGTRPKRRGKPVVKGETGPTWGTSRDIW